MLGFSFVLSAQEIKVSGFIKDSLNALPNANILAIPSSENVKMTFAISNQNGVYELTLQANASYELQISYLGYHPIKFSVTTSEENIIKDFILKESANELDEVVLNYKIPLVVKKDTLLYSVESFTDGKERKLREVLKKLPGVEVDKAGNVTVQGKKVTKVLVEGKTFFTGDSKLAVNNIPADAVDKVEVLDNYSEIPMLKGLQDSDEMAMDIKLKEDKKDFIFGDIEVGGGIKDRYVVHPNLFYYSPKTNVNVIGDFNNTGEKSFTFKDYIDFEGGYASLMSDSGASFDLYNSDFAKYLSNQDYKSNTNNFGGFNIRQSFSDVTDVNAYVIASDSKTETQTTTFNEYTSEEEFLEERNNQNRIDNSFLLGKVTLDYEPSYEEDLKLNSTIKLSKSNADGAITTVNPFQNNEIATKTAIESIDFTQDISYTRKLSKDHTGTLQSNFNYNESTPTTNWLTNQEILQGILPLENDSLYNIIQNKNSQRFNFDAAVKDYWVLNNFNHLYTSLGMKFERSNFFSDEYQRVSSGEENSFVDNSFGNDIDFNFSDVFIGMEYKFQRGIYIFKPALYYHFYNWQTYQVDSENNSKGLLLPQFTFKAEIRNSEKVNFKYGLKASFPSASELADRNRLSSFNSVFRGNALLQNSLYHSFSLSYYKFSLYKNLMINGRLGYNRKEKSFKSQTILDGIEQYSTLVMFTNPENNFTANGRISKKINSLKYTIRASYSYNDFYQLVNDITTQNNSEQTSFTASINTYFNKHWPELNVGYTKDFNNYKTPSFNTEFTNDEFFGELEYDFLKDFKFTFDYSRAKYQNKEEDIKNIFDIGNTSLYYQKEDSAWGFEIKATNLFDVQYKRTNSFSDFLISDSRTFILPRMVLFKVSYKL
ncbi:carboxypeptidase-like regulatory domain-containing protein [Joostella atrarenae]|uniref:carboxypeptidase-like regulatory domain-containing protein n=1 Tax=Joostella atrarenae TaxID=679257 RepID=UPI001F2879D4|nr:carboxypeptidase-like regulatory domain-containing protein [Joostella atrarenae]